MSKKPVIHNYQSLESLAYKFRDDLVTHNIVLLYAHNGTGKTRVSMSFKDIGKQPGEESRDTLYFNAFTEDLFVWNNDLKDNKDRYLMLNGESNFFSAFKDLEMDTRIRPFMQRYVNFDFTIDYDKRQVHFYKSIRVKVIEDGKELEKTDVITNIKVSRGEERLFVWCVFLAICELAIDGNKSYEWVKYFFIDDPMSSLDDNNAIGIATDLSKLLIGINGKIKAVISTHHPLFFNVLFNELKNKNSVRYFLYKSASNSYVLTNTKDTPYFHHVASLNELKQVMNSGDIKTYHFNVLRSILEKTASFFGYDKFGKCIHDIEDAVVFERALNLLSHGKYSIYEPVDMNDDNKDLFKRILSAFLDRYKFDLPEILNEGVAKTDGREVNTILEETVPVVEVPKYN